MYMADVEYHYYEARLTREMQDEGLVATATGLGLTTAATLVDPAQTKTILAGLATAVIGLDKAYSEKELLSNTIQALQTQMRADRKTQAGTIYAKMFRDTSSATRIVTPIADYTLPMALSDADAYYQAGTIASALIGFSKTLANADRNADEAKARSGPNPNTVSDVKETAAPSSVGGGVGPLRGSGPSVSGPVVRFRSTFVPDNSSDVLEKFLDPTGAGVRDPARVKIVTDLIAAKGLKVRLTMFLNAPEFAAKRAEVVQDLKRGQQL
jgi:hypothetical protein